MNPKHGDWNWFGNTNNLDFQYLKFLVHLVEIFIGFNMEKTKENEL